jgi:hypothetical protein
VANRVLPPDAVGGILHVTDHLARAKASIIEQYRDKTNFNGLVTPIVNQVQKLEDAFWDLLFRGDLSHANLVQNPGFELDSDNDGAADGWQGYSNLPDGAVTTTRVPGLFGNWAQRAAWAFNNTSQKGILLAGGFGIYGGWKPNTTYYHSWWERASGTNLGALMATGNWNQQPASESYLLNPPLTGDWQQYAKLITWGAVVEHQPTGGLYMSLVAGSGTQGTLDFDGVIVTEGLTNWKYETTGACFDLLGRILGEPRNGRADESYRRFLLAKIAINRGSGTAEDLYNIFTLILGSNSGARFTVQDFYPKSFVARVGTVAISDVAAADMATLTKRAKDAGAGSSFEYANTAPLFGFDGNGSGFDTGYFGGTL